MIRQRTFFFPWGLVLPALLLLAALSIVPLIYLLVASFTNYQLLIGAPLRFVGLANYAQLIHDPLFWHGLMLTLEFALEVVFVELPVAFLIALALFKMHRHAQTVATLLLIPTIISPMVASFQWIQLFNYQFGPVNYLLGLLHLGQPLWTASPGAAMPSLLIVDFWEWTPFMILLLYAGLQSLPKSALEAARVDGSTYWQSVRNVVIPLLRPVILVAVILRLVSVFKLFDTVYAVTGGGPGVATENLAYYMYQQAFQYFNISYSGALALVELVAVSLLSAGILRFDRSAQIQRAEHRRRARASAPAPVPGGVVR